MISRTSFFLALLSVFASRTAHAATYGVGGCNNNIQNFPSIQAAVNAVPPGSTIVVCPGTYAEQVTITQPLTLQGQAFKNAGRVVITVPPGPHDPNMTPLWSLPTFAQVLVQNGTTPGPVNIIGITVDGQGAADENGLPLCTTGILYDSGTSGTVNEVATRNQLGVTQDQFQYPCGYGIWVENLPGPTENITIENSSVHDYAWAGISTYTVPDAVNLNATIYANFVTGTPQLTAIASDASSTISKNLVSAGGQDGINVLPPVCCSPGGHSNIVGNTVVDANAQSGIDSIGNSSIQGNKISNAGFGINESSGDNIAGNQVMNTATGISMLCGAGGSISQNLINDSRLGLLNTGSSTVSGNQFANIDVVLQPLNCN